LIASRSAQASRQRAVLLSAGEVHISIMRSDPLVQSLESLIEALLLVAGAPVTIDDLAKAIGTEPELVSESLDCLADQYASRGFRVQRSRNRVQLVTAPEMASYVEEFLGVVSSGKLSSAALETLAVVAYNQPVTRAQVESIRGVSCDGVLRTLVAHDLIHIVGRLAQAGRPLIYETTFAFLEHFGLQNLSELPPLDLENEDNAVGPLDP